MEIWLWALVGFLFILVLLLAGKIVLFRKAARELAESFADRLITGTNTLLDLPCRDKEMLRLAHSLNMQLRKLREERHRFCQGDAELKHAIMNISHDLRTPLTAICGYLDLLKREELTKEAKRYLSVIENRTTVLKQLTEELFSYSIILSAAEIKKETVVLNDVLEEGLAAYYAAFRQRNITPEIQMPEKKVVRQLDRKLLSRIVANLLSNVLKYSDGDLEVLLEETGEIVFINTASQLDEILAGRLFDRFYTVETGRNATGLGLSIARTLAEQMGGRMKAQYRDGKLMIYLQFLNKI